MPQCDILGASATCRINASIPLPTAWRSSCATYGYEKIETPIIQPADLFLTKAGDQIIHRLFTFERHGAPACAAPGIHRARRAHLRHALPGSAAAGRALAVRRLDLRGSVGRSSALQHRRGIDRHGRRCRRSRDHGAGDQVRGGAGTGSPDAGDRSRRIDAPAARPLPTRQPHAAFSAQSPARAQSNSARAVRAGQIDTLLLGKSGFDDPPSTPKSARNSARSRCWTCCSTRLSTA